MLVDHWTHLIVKPILYSLYISHTGCNRLGGCIYIDGCDYYVSCLWYVHAPCGSFELWSTRAHSKTPLHASSVRKNTEKHFFDNNLFAVDETNSPKTVQEFLIWIITAVPAIGDLCRDSISTARNAVDCSSLISRFRRPKVLVWAPVMMYMHLGIFWVYLLTTSSYLNTGCCRLHFRGDVYLRNSLR